MLTVIFNQPGTIIKMTPFGTVIRGDYINGAFPEHLLIRSGDPYIPLRFVIRHLEKSHISGRIDPEADGNFRVRVTVTGDPTPQPT